MSTSTPDKHNNIQVAVRCRPLKAGETHVLSTEALRGRSVTIDSTHSTSHQKTYTFDHVFGEQSDQAMVYADVGAPIVDEMLQGFNCTIFAYGMTGTGKTYTMAMDEKDTQLSPSDRSDISNGAGIIPRALHSIFNKLEAQNAECSVRVSYIELYNEELRDLLSLNYKPPQSGSSSNSNTTSNGDGLKMFGDPKGRGGVIIQGLEETLVNSAEMAFEAFERGSRRRRIASTNCNEYSSRSHSVFTITVHIKDVSDSGHDIVKVGKLNLVDLAGSENIGRSGAVDLRAREAGNINASLLALGRVINGLVERSDKNRNKKQSDKTADKSYIPYRDSKLTRLLQDSLGGETKTFIIATISPSKTSIEETLSTLDYALRAKSIENKPQVQQKTSKNMYINDLVAENVRLKAEFKASVEHNNGMWFTKDKVAAYEHLQENKEKCDKERQGFVAAEKEHMHTLQKLDLADNDIIIKRNTIAKLEKEVDGLLKELEEERIVNDVRERGEQVNWNAANSWLRHAKEEHQDVVTLHGVLDSKLLEAESDRGTLHTYADDTRGVVEQCTHTSSTHSQFIDHAVSEMEAKKTALHATLNALPQLAENVMGDSTRKLRSIIDELAQREEENTVASQLSTDAIQTSGQQVSATLASVVQELDQASERFSKTLSELLEKEMSGFDSKLQTLFTEYTQRSEERVRAMHADVERLKTLHDFAQSDADHKEDQLSTIRTHLQQYEQEAKRIQEERLRSVVDVVSQALRRHDELDAGNSNAHLQPTNTGITSLLSRVEESRSHHLSELQVLSASTTHHATAERDECEAQKHAWDEVQRALRDVKIGVDEALAENASVVATTHERIEDSGKRDVEEIVRRCEASKERVQNAHDSFTQLSKSAATSTHDILNDVAISVTRSHALINADATAWSTLANETAAQSKSTALEMSQSTRRVADGLDKLMVTLNVLRDNVDSQPSTSTIPLKREFVNDDAYDMQQTLSRDALLKCTNDGAPSKRSRSLGGDAVAAPLVNNAATHHPHAPRNAIARHTHDSDDRQGSAPPEMSPRKQSYTVDVLHRNAHAHANAQEQEQELDTGAVFRNTLSNLREEASDGAVADANVDNNGDVAMEDADADANGVNGEHDQEQEQEQEQVHGLDQVEAPKAVADVADKEDVSARDEEAAPPVAHAAPPHTSRNTSRTVKPARSARELRQPPKDKVGLGRPPPSSSSSQHAEGSRVTRNRAPLRTASSNNLTASSSTSTSNSAPTRSTRTTTTHTHAKTASASAPARKRTVR